MRGTEESETYQLQGVATSDHQMIEQQLGLEDARTVKESSREQHTPFTNVSSITGHSIRSRTYDDNGRTRAILSKDESSTEDSSSSSTGQILSSQKRSRACRVPEVSWLQVRGYVEFLYWTEKKTLRSVMEVLRNTGFAAT
jgi:hypothetical protein